MHNMFSAPVQKESKERKFKMPHFDRFSLRGANGKLGKYAVYTGITVAAWSGAAKITDFPVTPLNTVGILAQGIGVGLDGVGTAFQKTGDGLMWVNDFLFDDDGAESAATTTTTTSPVQTLPPTTLPAGANVGPTVPPFVATASTLPPLELSTTSLAPEVASAPQSSQSSGGNFTAGPLVCSDQLALVTIASDEYPYNAASRVTGFPFEKLENATTGTGDLVWSSILNIPENATAKAVGSLSTGDSFYAPLGCTIDPEYLLS